MTWPATVITRYVSFGKAVILETGTDLSLRAVTRASRSLVSMAEGFRMETQSASVETAEPGEEITFLLPVTNQPGWADAATGMALEVGGDRHSHLYTTTLTIYSGSTMVRTYQIGPYPVPQGAGILDGDTMLVPSGTEDGALIPLPEAWAQIIEDASAILGLRGEPDGIAELDESGVVPDAQLPSRLSEAGLNEVADGRIEATVPPLIDAAVAGAALNPYPLVRNASALAPFRAKLGLARKELVRITVLGDSIAWGVGADGDSAQQYPYTATQQEFYRENAWPYLLSESLSAIYGLPSVPGWMGPAFSDQVGGGGWQSATTGYTSEGASAAARSANVGPFGNHVNAQRGGVAISVNAYVEWSAQALSRPFTAVDVYYFGAAAGVTNPTDPTVIVDGETKHVAAGVAAGGYMKITVDGLDPTTHTVRLHNLVPSRTVYGAFIVPRNDTGIVANRIGSPGATTSDAIAASGSTQRDRIVQASVMPGDTDLLILAFATNDHGNQVPLATFKSNLQTLIDAATCPVLLLDGPPKNVPTGTITPAQYTTALHELATANSSKVAAANLSTVFGTRAAAVSAGLFATPTTVHPSFIGMKRIADYVSFALTSSVSAS